MLVIIILSVVVLMQALGLFCFVLKKPFREIRDKIVIRHPIRDIADTSSQVEDYQQLCSSNLNKY